MRLWSSHFPPVDAAHPERPPVLVPEGFSWWGLFLGWLVLLRPGSWLVALLAGCATLLLTLLARHAPSLWMLIPAMHLTVALFAHDWRRWELRLGGFTDGPLVAGESSAGALLRLLDGNPTLLRPA